MPTSRSADRIAVTLGDPAGIGPEVTLKALERLRRDPRARFVLVGDASHYASLAKSFRLPLAFYDARPGAEPRPASSELPCILPGAVGSRVKFGRSDKALTRACVRSIEIAVRLAMKGHVDAIVTPPINKTGVREAGYDIPGHTEYLARLAKTKRFEMMLVGGGLRVVLVTRHVPIARVSSGLTARRIEEAIVMADRELRASFGIARPRLAVAGLNPHAGESGHIGKEEIRLIAPAVKRARKKVRSTVDGPLPPDVLFHYAYRGRYDAEICMYHDQGLIPLKMISRGAGVNVTLGLPFIRTSPDHGTAYDIAGKGAADAGSMEEAIQLALSLAHHRRGPRSGR